MELGGTYKLNATPQQVWEALFDEAVLEKSIPGCRELQKTGDTTFNAVVQLKIGPVSARFKGDVELSDIVPLSSCTLTGKGSGGIAGFAKGSSQVTLTEIPDGTTLSYVAEAAVGGKLAALGSRLIRSASQKLADEFFSNFSSVLTADHAESQAT